MSNNAVVTPWGLRDRQPAQMYPRFAHCYPGAECPDL